MSTWYYRLSDGREQGPVPFTELQALAREGRLDETDVVRRTGADEWEKAYRVIGLFKSVEAEAARAAPLSAAEAAAAALAAPAPQMAPRELKWWQLPIDRFEACLLVALTLLIAGYAAYWQITEREKERFPKSEGGPRYPVPSAEQYEQMKQQAGQ